MSENKMQAIGNIFKDFQINVEFTKKMLSVIKYFWFFLDHVTIPSDQKYRNSDVLAYLLKNSYNHILWPNKHFNWFEKCGDVIMNMVEKNQDFIITEQTFYFTFRDLEKCSKVLHTNIEIPIKVRFGDRWSIKYKHGSTSFSEAELNSIDLAAKWIWFRIQYPCIYINERIKPSTSWSKMIAWTKEKMEFFGFTKVETNNFIFYGRNGESLDILSKIHNNRSCELFTIKLKNAPKNFKWFDNQRFILRFRWIDSLDDKFANLEKYLKLLDATNPFDCQWLMSFESSYKQLFEMIFTKTNYDWLFWKRFSDTVDYSIDSSKIKSIHEELWENNFYPVNIAVPFVFTDKASQKQFKALIHFTNIDAYGGKTRFDQAGRILNEIASEGIDGTSLTSESTYEDALTLLNKQLLHSGYFNNIAWEMANDAQALLKTDRDFTKGAATIKVRIHTLKPAQFDIKPIDIPKKARYSSDWISVKFHDMFLFLDALKSRFSQQMLRVIKYFWFYLDYVTVPRNKKYFEADVLSSIYKKGQNNNLWPNNIIFESFQGCKRSRTCQVIPRDADPIITEHTLYFTFLNLQPCSNQLNTKIEIPVKVRFDDIWKIKYKHESTFFSQVDLDSIDLAAKWIWFQYQFPSIYIDERIEPSTSWSKMIETTKQKMALFGFTAAEIDNLIFYGKNGENLDALSKIHNNRSSELFTIKLKNVPKNFKWFDNERFILLFTSKAGLDDKFANLEKYLKLFDTTNPFDCRSLLSFENFYSQLIEMIFQKNNFGWSSWNIFMDHVDFSIDSSKIKSIHEELWENNFYPVNIAVPFVFTDKASQKQFKALIHFNNIDAYGGKIRFDQAVRMLNEIASEGIDGTSLTSESTYEDALTLLKKQLLHSGYFNNIAWEMANDAQALLKTDRDFTKGAATIKVRLQSFQLLKFNSNKNIFPEKKRYSSDRIDVQFHGIQS